MTNKTAIITEGNSELGLESVKIVASTKKIHYSSQSHNLQGIQGVDIKNSLSNLIRSPS